MLQNPATKPSNELNVFTDLVATYGKQNWEDRRDLYVRLRNGTLVRPIYKLAEDETCEDAFFTEDYKYCWNLDGTSVTNPKFDMMEIV